MRASTAVLAISVVVAACSACGGPHPGPTAQPVAADLRAGALFLGESDLHTCSGAVLHSTTGDLVLTAAHCVSGGVTATFVPGLTADGPPTDAWRVDAVYLDERWIRDQDPRADYAIVRVSRADGMRLESVVGQGLSLGHAPASGTDVSVTGYAFGSGQTPIGCLGQTHVADGYPVLECDGMVAGTSGSPWISGSTVTGVTGGLDGGGCHDDVSYSAPFDGQTAALLERAEAGGPGDDAPEVVGDDC